MTSLQGEATTLRDLTGGGAALVVDVASRCGLTPRDTRLEALQQEYGGRGPTVVGVPCDRFAGQEPGTPAEIAGSCEVPDASGEAGDVQWDPETWLVGADGEVVARFRPPTQPDAPGVRHAIEEVLHR